MVFIDDTRKLKSTGRAFDTSLISLYTSIITSEPVNDIMYPRFDGKLISNILYDYGEVPQNAMSSSKREDNGTNVPYLSFLRFMGRISGCRNNVFQIWDLDPHVLFFLLDLVNDVR